MDTTREEYLAICSHCGTVFDCSEPVCPKCGSNDRIISLEDCLCINDSEMKLKAEVDKTIYDGGKKYAYEVTVKPNFDRDSQQKTIVVRYYARTEKMAFEKQTYVEKIWTLDGKLLKEKKEDLREHIGHGDDKKNKRLKAGGDTDA